MQHIAIHSVPRSGSTWLGNIFNSHPSVSFKYQPLFSYAFKDYLDENTSSEKIIRFFEEINKSDDAFINQLDGIKKGIIPVFKKENTSTYICYKEVRYHYVLQNLLVKSPQVKVILLIRNPLAVLNSWKNAPREFRSDLGWDFNKEWLDAQSKNLNKKEEFYGYNKWKEATLLFLNLQAQFPKNVIVISYNDLLLKALEETKKIFKFCNLSLAEETITFLQASRAKTNEDVYSVFKEKKTDLDWVNLPKDIIDFVCNDLKGTEFEMYLD